MIKLHSIEILKERHWNLPSASVKSDRNISLTNKGYNTFVATEEIDENILLELRDIFWNEGDLAHVTIQGPTVTTWGFYTIKASSKFFPLEGTGNLNF